MPDAVAKIWSQCFDLDSFDERSRYLAKIAKYSFSRVIALASRGRKSYQNPDFDDELHLLARRRVRNTLFDVVEIRTQVRRTRKTITSIETYPEFTVSFIPRGYLFQCRPTASTEHGDWGKEKTWSPRGTVPRYLPTFERAIPLLKSYTGWGHTITCAWTAKEGLKEARGWLKALNSSDNAVRRDMILNGWKVAMWLEMAPEAARAVRLRALTAHNKGLKDSREDVRIAARNNLGWLDVMSDKSVPARS